MNTSATQHQNLNYLPSPLIATQPDILLCDEATSALDPKTTESILELLRKVNRELGVTIVFVTHMINVITRLCNRVAVMEKGRVVEEGATVDVFSAPKAALTRDFVSTVIPDRIPEAIRESLKTETRPYHGERTASSAGHSPRIH